MVRIKGRALEFNELQSVVMSETHELEKHFEYWIFDYVANDYKLTRPYHKRVNDYLTWNLLSNKFPYELLEPVLIKDFVKLTIYTKRMLKKGYEGVIIRDPKSPYKCGRSTEKQGWMLKIKPYEDSEAVIIGFKEEMANTNEKEKDEFGLTKRSHKKAGKVGKDTLGKLLVRDIHTGVEFKIGTGKGLTKQLRKEIWDNRKKYKGKIVKYCYQKHGQKDKPRIPSMQGFRDPRDMS